jgi:two-component system, chemotaxis family, chemotaxis protein CheY
MKPDPKLVQESQTVVVIEDDLDIREAICDMLEFEGYPVVSFGNGKEAFEHIYETKNPGLILLDLMMPVMNGVQFLRARQNDEELLGIPVFVFSAVGEKKELIREGAQGFLRKPLDAEDILDVVKAHIYTKAPRKVAILH